MHVSTGYRDLSLRFDDVNILQQPDVNGKTLPPVTRVIPDCGHTYFFHGHDPEPHLITSLCRGCQSQRDLKQAQHDYDMYKWTQLTPEIRGSIPVEAPGE